MNDARPPRQAVRTLQPRKRIALIAHDGKKTEMLEWATRWQETLSQHTLIGTGTTAGRLKTALGLEVEGLMSGPLGGDAQIAELVLEHQCQRVIFFEDPHVARQHEADIQLLERAVRVVTESATCATSPSVARRWAQAVELRAGRG